MNFTKLLRTAVLMNTSGGCFRKLPDLTYLTHISPISHSSCSKVIIKLCFEQISGEQDLISVKFIIEKFYHINPIQDGLFRCYSRMGGGQKGPHSIKSVTHILQWWNLAQLYLSQRRSKKYMNHVTHPLSSANISIFPPEISKFYYIKKYSYRSHFDT